MPALVPSAAIAAAAARIEGVARHTPLVELPVEVGGPVYAKCENLQAGGAFKIRGAYNFIARLDGAAAGPGVITYSSGNHAQAVALAARRRGLAAVVVMPTTAPAVKVEGARQLGAEVHFEGTTSIDRKRRAEALAEERGLTMVPPFDHPDIVAGQGTVGLEILKDCPELSRVLVPVGGGGLVAGVATAVKSVRPDVTVVGVEPSGAPKMSESLAVGYPVTLDQVSSIADGLIPVRPGDLTFAHVRRYVDEVVTVDDASIAAATRWYADRAKLVVETSGAATLAALQSGAVPTRDGTTVAVVSGGNVSLDTLHSLPD